MRFRAQLIVGIGMLVVIATGISVVSVGTLHVANSRATKLTRHVFEDVAAAQAVRVRAEQVVSAARGYLLSGDEAYRRKLDDHERELDLLLADLRAIHDGTSASLNLVEQRLLEYSRATTAVARQRSANDDVASLARSFEQQVAPKRRALDAAVKSLVALQRARVEAEAERASEHGRRFVIAVVLACCLGIAVSIALGFVIIRKLNRQYRREQLAKREAAEAASARKQLLEIVAHDLLSPLNAIVLGIEVMEQGGRAVPHASTIKRSAERMQRLVGDLLDVSRVETKGFELARTEQDVAPLLETMREQFLERARCSEVELRIQAPPDLRAFVDRDRIFQILANLVGNALRYARSGDEIVLGASPLPSGAARFFVKDAGPGIPREELDELFQAYRQGSGGTRRGTLGLGLYISKMLVEAHGGRIGADSAPGSGSTFWFDIPGLDANVARAAQRPEDRTRV